MAEIIEDIFPVYNIKISLKTEKKIRRVYLPLKNEELSFNQSNGQVEFILACLECHQTIVAEY